MVFLGKITIKKESCKLTFKGFTTNSTLLATTAARRLYRYFTATFSGLNFYKTSCHSSLDTAGSNASTIKNETDLNFI